MIKIRKNSKAKAWNVYASNLEKLGTFTFHLQEVKAYFPGCAIKGHDVFLA